eukprot:gnl/MRDRNA2_/MRDRNA2_109945_c0_seq1.p1 gnl/MRDRNA2_/MRDRNA2_109945_c0~~gnl/MRDRNA2_/MRDRNA2_109945_c0_seq1.p1  ORF type:complete len:285 (-),score=79.20 gnl/MRDRNA2_/MRDRNA2_109945_c0_seq1:150-1004(-)
MEDTESDTEVGNAEQENFQEERRLRRDFRRLNKEVQLAYAQTMELNQCAHISELRAELEEANMYLQNRASAMVSLHCEAQEARAAVKTAVAEAMEHAQHEMYAVDSSSVTKEEKIQEELRKLTAEKQRFEEENKRLQDRIWTHQEAEKQLDFLQEENRRLQAENRSLQIAKHKVNGAKNDQDEHTDNGFSSYHRFKELICGENDSLQLRGPVEIQEATYGQLNDPSCCIDLTLEIQEVVKKATTLPIRIKKQEKWGDPAPWKLKAIRVRFRPVEWWNDNNKDAD